MRKLNSLKNLIWIAAIVLCLLALTIGLFTAAFTRYDGEKERGGVLLGGGSASHGGSTAAAGTDGVDGGMDVTLVGDGNLKRLEETADGGQAYVDSLTFLVDSALIGLRDYGLLSDGTQTTQVWGSAAGNIPADSIADCVIRYPNDGSEISAVNAAMVARPERLVICLGSDGLAKVDRETFIDSYTRLLQGLRSASPDTVIIVCSLPSVSPSYDGVDNLSSYLVGEANDWIRDVCTDTGVYYADAGSAVRDRSGTLMTEYAAANGKTLNTAGVNLFLSYLRTHTA